jgi:hypothetical protein
MVDVAAEWAALVGPPGEDERDMIEDTLGQVPEGRRLCCRIAVTETLDGWCCTSRRPRYERHGPRPAAAA